jgi:hypothetical protein
MHTLLVTAILGTIVVVACPGAVAAQPVDTQADLLFEQGRDLLIAGEYAEACAAFDASQKIAPAITTLVNQASCREKNGQLASAWSLFVEAERQTRESTNESTNESNNESTRKLHRLAVDRTARLEARLSTLTINVPADRRIGGLEILRNGDRVHPEVWNEAVPIDGGTYTVTVRVPGSPDRSVAITVGVERDPRTIEVSKLMATALAPTPAPTRPRSHAVPRERSPAIHHRTILPLILVGGAVTLLGGAAGFARWGNLTYERAKAATDEATQTSLWRAANQKRYVAEAMLGAGIGLAGVALWLRLRGRTETRRGTAARHGNVTVAPLVSADMIGLDLGRSW